MPQVLQIADFKVGVCHGHQVVPWGDKEALAILQRQMGVDILVTGHTHEFKVSTGTVWVTICCDSTAVVALWPQCRQYWLCGNSTARAQEQAVGAV
jgi:putative phosphoesterase